jgi:hypothetical protein
MVLAYGLRGNISMASHDSACGPNVLPLNRREVLTLTGAASAVATTQAFTNAASAAAEHTPHIVMADALTLADTIRSRHMMARLEAGDFYILCPDNDVPHWLDERRILWAAGDIVDNRPPLSRWHPDYADAFAAFVKKETGLLRRGHDELSRSH